MKKTVLTLGIISLFFTACKKEQATTSDQPTINVSDTKALTSAITVYHSLKIKGAVPAPSTGAGAPVLDPGSDNQQINAMNGRYAVIKPSVFSGDVAGYYLKINGADFYYKIDFSKPRLSANRLAGKTTGLHNRLFSIGRQANANRADSTQPGYADSSIIIQLPANIGIGTFCAEYWMYNDQDQLSNPIKICVTVNQLGGGADGAGFVGKWKETKEKYTDPRQDTNWHTITYAKEYAETSNFLCDNGVLYYSTDSSGSNPDILHIANRYYWNKKADFIFALNGGVEYLNDWEEGFLDTEASSCSNYVYRAEGPGLEDNIGGWSYNSTTKKLVFVFDFNGTGTGEPEAFELTVTSKTDTGFTLHDEIDNSWFEFMKQ